MGEIIANGYKIWKREGLGAGIHIAMYRVVGEKPEVVELLQQSILVHVQVLEQLALILEQILVQLALVQVQDLVQLALISEQILI